MGTQLVVEESHESKPDQHHLHHHHHHFNTPSLSIQFSAEQKPLKSGYLLKRGFKNFASWKRRYCVMLANGLFNYYNSKHKIKGSVLFSNAHQCISCSKDSKKFYVLTAKRTWEFKAESKNEANSWIKLIQKIMLKQNGKTSSKIKKPSEHQHHHKHPMYHTHKMVEFDSDDDIDSVSSTSYIRKHKKRRSVLSMSSNTTNTTKTTDYSSNNIKDNITFESFKVSITNALRDVIVTVENRQKIKNYDPNNYDDGFHTIAVILNDAEKLKTIFYRITNNQQYMTMKQYIASMSLIQKSKTEIGSIAKKLLHDDEKDQVNQKHFDTQSMISTLSTLSYFDDTQSVISDLSTSRMSVSKTRTPRAMSRISMRYSNHDWNDHDNMPSFKLSFARNNSILSNIENAFSILEKGFDEEKEDDDDDDDEVPEFAELQFDEYHQHEEEDEDEKKYIVEEEQRIIVEIPNNAASEIFGNFLGASVGLCVPGLDVISSFDSAETYKLLSEYTSNIDESGNPPTLLVYEELDGVSLSDLKQQLEVVQISLHYNSNSDSNTTTQERIQRYFVSVVRKTFGQQLPFSFSRDGRSMIRDAGFVFAVDMFLFNVSRFPVLLPFEGKPNPNNLFISTDEDGDSALYGLRNRFMGGFDIIDMPYYLVNGGIMDLKDTKAIKVLLDKQQQYTQAYIGKLQKFLSVLSDYYQTKILPNMTKNGPNGPQKNHYNVSHNPHLLIHGLPNKTNNNRFVQINHESIIDKCLRPIANYLYIHCGFELIIIDEYNNNPNLMSPRTSMDEQDGKNDKDNNKDKGKEKEKEKNDKEALHVLEIYRNKLIDNMITLLCEGILIGISEISDQLEIKDIDILIQDIKSLDENMFGIELLSAEFLKLVLRLFHSTSVSFQLCISEDSSSDEDEQSDDDDEHQHKPYQSSSVQDIESEF